MIDCKNCKYEDMCLIKDKTSKKIEMCTIFETAEKQTNADRIRSMNDEELAAFLANFAWDNEPTKKETYEWLQSEVEE